MKFHATDFSHMHMHPNATIHHDHTLVIWRINPWSLRFHGTWWRKMVGRIVLTGSDGFDPALITRGKIRIKNILNWRSLWEVVGRWGCAPEIRWMKMFFFVLRDANFFEQIFAENWSLNSGLGRLRNESSASLNYSGNKVVDITSDFRTCLCKGH